MQRSGLPVAPMAAAQAYAQAGGLAGMFGALAGMGGTKPVAPAVPAAAPAPVQGSAGLGAQAHARKAHLTNLFLARGCKLSDVSK
jgi:hypothetical protein